MLRETDHEQIVRFLLLFSSGPPNIFYSTRVNLRLTVQSKTQRIQDGRKQIARVRFFHALMQLSDELIAWLAHTHTQREREREIHILWQCRRCVRTQIYFYTQQPELMLFMLVTYVFFLCARPSFSFDSSHKQHLFPPRLRNITQDGPLRNVVLRLHTQKRNGCFK